MSTEENKRIVERFAEEWNKGNLEGVLALVADNVVDHNPPPGQPSGKEGMRQGFAMFKNTFPDLRLNNDLIIAEGDRVVDHGVARGTQKGELMGIPATNKPVAVEYTDIYRVANGKIAEIWHL
ncbi:MAG: ester cyclase, partial [Chloroflexota bacterium]